MSDLGDHIKDYSLKIEEKKSAISKDTFTILQDKERSDIPPVIVQYFDGNIYAVKFLNNDFFEIDESALYEVIQGLLAGDYEVKHTLFGKPYVLVGENRIYSERIYDLKEYYKQYEGLPARFSQK